MSRKPGRQHQSFERFYFDKVATGEGCGCAERVIDVHEFNRLAGRSRPRLPLMVWPSRAGLVRFLQKAGLTRRPKRPAAQDAGPEPADLGRD